MTIGDRLTRLTGAPSSVRLAAGLACACLLATWGWFRLGEAGDAQRTRLAAAHQQAADLVRLQDLQARLGGGSGPVIAASAVQSAVSEILAFIGVPPGACASVTAHPQGGRQGLDVRLIGMTPAQVGNWCAGWENRRTGWRIAELTWKTGMPSLVPSDAQRPLDASPADLRLLLLAPVNP